jgi:L-alanine-DL-glutamate epimerase-like enolase superfamily enzyme
MALKVTDIKTFVVDGGFRPWTFVKIEMSDPGVVGWGDCTDWGAPRPITAMVERLSEFVIGRDPTQAEAIWWDLHNANMRHTAGIASKGMSGIDSALWDIRGKVLNAPVWQLLGGKMRDELRLYWSHCGSTRAREKSMTDRLGITKRVETTDDIRELAQEVKDRGYTAIKTNMIKLKDRPDAQPIRSGRGGAAHAGDAPASARRNAEAVVGTFREALGPDIGIAIDVAFSFKLGGAIKLAQTLEPFDMMWLETETFDPEALRVIRNSPPQRSAPARAYLGLSATGRSCRTTRRTSSCRTSPGTASPWARRSPIWPTHTTRCSPRTTATVPSIHGSPQPSAPPSSTSSSRSSTSTTLPGATTS